MRRATNLFDRIAEPENLRLAFHKAARGRRGQVIVQHFAASLDCNIADMSASIREGTFPVGRFHQFLIRDPKERVITAPCFDERVLHHAIMNVCEPVMERWLIDDTFACRWPVWRCGGAGIAGCREAKECDRWRVSRRERAHSETHIKPWTSAKIKR